MAAVSTHLTATLPCLPTLRARPRRLPPNAVAASVAPLWTAHVALRDCRNCHPLSRSFYGFESAVSLRMERKKQAVFASDRDSPNPISKQSSSSDDNSSSSTGPPVLTILAGVIVFLLVIWVAGSFLTWIVSLVFGAAKS
ncbi:hypothetical protein EJB05_08161 [Eragrostis curvula]|uniref:Uncharacterized protein n=1 Tax=Eragrostis curvula TaxID=38414 RepID=A0A5J9WKB4_9POAL|nr:hypothetical protein EJB05_08161 [Eragrostis curvula]